MILDLRLCAHCLVMMILCTLQTVTTFNSTLQLSKSTASRHLQEGVVSMPTLTTLFAYSKRPMV